MGKPEVVSAYLTKPGDFTSVRHLFAFHIRKLTFACAYQAGVSGMGTPELLLEQVQRPSTIGAEVEIVADWELLFAG